MGYNAATLHGGKGQEQRDTALAGSNNLIHLRKIKIISLIFFDILKIHDLIFSKFYDLILILKNILIWYSQKFMIWYSQNTMIGYSQNFTNWYS